MKSNGNRYNDELKADAVRLIVEEGRSYSSVSKDLGINPQTLRNCVDDKKKVQNPTEARIAELEALLKEKERKISELEDSVTILKKATAIFIQGNRK